MKKNILKTLIKVCIVLAVITFICSFWSPWSAIAWFVFSSTAMTLSIFNSIM